MSLNSLNQDKKGIVTKPQFDLNYFTKGNAVITTSRVNIVRHAIIGDINPLSMELWYYSNSEHDWTSTTVSIEEVVNGSVEIEILVPQSHLEAFMRSTKATNKEELTF